MGQGVDGLMASMRRTRNSPIAAALTVVGAIVAFLAGGWVALAAYVAGFSVGGVGTAVNARRAGVRW